MTSRPIDGRARRRCGCRARRAVRAARRRASAIGWQARRCRRRGPCRRRRAWRLRRRRRRRSAPATSRSTGPSFSAAATMRAVAGESLPRSCSARTSTAHQQRLQLGDIGGDGGGQLGDDQRPCALRRARAAGETFSMVRRGARSTPNSAAGRTASGFWRAFITIGSAALRGVLRRRSAVTMAGSGDANGCAAVIDLAGDFEPLPHDLDLGGEGGLRPVEQAGEHLADVIGVVIDGLLAEQDQIGLLLGDDGLSAAWRRRGFRARHRFRSGCRDGRPWRGR